MMLGTAAIRSISAISGRRSRCGAYSETKIAVASATGTAITSAIAAMMTPFGSSVAIPNRLAAGIQVFVVKKLNPALWKALVARSTRNSAISPVMTSTAAPADRSTPRNILSAREVAVVIGRGTSPSVPSVPSVPTGGVRNGSSGEVAELVTVAPASAGRR